MGRFFLAYPASEISQTLSGKLNLAELAQVFTLPWSAYVRLLVVKDDQARRFYETEALRGGWSVRQLDRQIGSQFYERTALSKNKAAMLVKGAVPKPEDAVTPDDAIKDPYVLEFLNHKDEYSESDLEQALIRRLEDFVLELGEGLTFIGRQRRLRIDQTWYRVDLLLFHRKLRCLVIIDLKLGSLTHADVDRMPKFCKRSWKLRGACWSRVWLSSPRSSVNSRASRLAAVGFADRTSLRYRWIGRLSNVALAEHKLAACRVASTEAGALARFTGLRPMRSKPP